MKGQNIGYARVSSTDQNLEVQRHKLKDCDKVFEEKVSGTNQKRAKLEECLNYVREGDTLIVTRLDRLARSTLHLCQIAKDLEARGVNLKVLDQNIDTSSATGHLLFNMLGAIGQFETEIRAERQSEGIKNSIRSGVKFGREQKLTNEQLQELKERRKNNTLIKTLMADYGLSKTSYDEPQIVSSRCITGPQESLQKFSLEPAAFKEIIKTVSRYYKVAEKSLFTCQPGVKNNPRDVAIYLAREEASIKMCDIARKFSIGRTAASNVFSRIKIRIQKESSFKAEIEILSNAIHADKSY